ncbi:Membrane protein involved in the export of O-antigen and teichoic acid [Collimonas sp. OK607]|uniref:flippase n=1 Tax=Collimonas sp. OK607 TaxID=1798194 RepID=UPI0008E23CCE|nr:flippase [Collimonas sp. OK607]SFA80042.1 Membrane protein involved in the export of O-antigen and teichoic acid [Collimonas sp. OK607]
MSIKKNTIWNLAGTGAPLLVGIFSIPYLMSELGVEAFGILTLVWALIGYFSLFDFGLGRALTQKVASQRALGITHELPQLIKAGLVFTIAAGIIGGIILALLAAPLGYSWLNVSILLRKNAVYSLAIAAIGIPLTTITTGLRGVLEGYEDFKKINLLKMLLGVANFGLPVISIIVFGPVLEIAVASLVFARLLNMVLHIYPIKEKLGWTWISAKTSYAHVRDLWQFGIWMTISNIISPLMVTADRFLISAIIGAASVAYYTVPFDALIRVLIIPGALTAALFPRLSSLISTDIVVANILYKRSVLIVVKVMIPVCLIIALGSYLGLSLWLGVDFAKKSWMLTSILAFGILFNGIAQIPFAVIQASGNVRTTALIHFFELIAYVPLLLIALKFFGLLGAAGIWVLRVGMDLFILQSVAKSTLRK